MPLRSDHRTASYLDSERPLRAVYRATGPNDAKTGIPGSVDPMHPGIPFWELAPAVVAWESAPGVPFTGPELCAQLKDPARNGHRSLGNYMVNKA